VPREAGRLQRRVDQLSVRRRCEPERPAGHDPLDRLHGAGNERQLARVQLEHPVGDLGADLLGRLGKPDPLVHVDRPFARAHAHHVRLRALVPPAVTLARKTLAHLVPQLLRVEQHAVEIEDDGLDHRPRYALSM
jgi:hypothetical protein